MTTIVATTSTLPLKVVYEDEPALTKSERQVVDAIRRIRRGGKPGMLALYVDLRSVSIRVCGPPERITDP